jgi:hypothetical protein
VTLSDEELLDVMSFADGELEGADAERVEALVLANADAKELVLSMRALGEGVRAAAAAAPTIDVSSAVLTHILPNDLDKGRLKRQARTRTLAVAATLTALAAGAYLYTRGEPDEAPTANVPTTNAPEPQQIGPSIVPAPMAMTPALAKNETPGIQIDSVDTTRPVSVFYVSPGDDNSSASSSVVVWIDDPAAGAK